MRKLLPIVYFWPVALAAQMPQPPQPSVEELLARLAIIEQQRNEQANVVVALGAQLQMERKVREEAAKVCKPEPVKKD